MEKVEYAGWKNCIRLTNGRIELIATTDVGPRVVRFGFVGGANIMKEFPDQQGRTGGNEWRIYGGHRLWHAPEMKPRTYHPDNDPVEHSFADGVLKLKQKPESTTGLRKEIEISMSRAADSATLLHRITNEGPWEVEFAPWCLSVLSPGGRSILPHEPFVPFPDQLLPASPLVLWSYTVMSDPRFQWGDRFIQMRQDPSAKHPTKYGVGNKVGWGAYVLGDNVFVKLADYVAGAQYPDMGCSWELYTNADMLELETLGPLAKLPPGQSVEHRERWGLYKAQVGETEGEIAKTLLPLVETARRQ